MPNQAGIQSKINRGLGIAASKLGAAFDLYRPSSANQPISSGNLIRTILADFDVKATYSYDAVSLHKNPYFYGLFDGSQTQPYDYLVNGTTIYFVAAQPPVRPILCIGCNRVLSFAAAASETQVGEGPYGGRTVGTDVAFAADWPASVLQGTRGESTLERLPQDTRAPWWDILLPAIPGVVLSMGDFLTDDLGRRYVISSAELSNLGWRLTVGEQEP